jgi:nucleotide-binding universal stress UspA family protein
MGQAAFMPTAVATPAQTQLSPLGRFERFLVATDGSEYSAGAVREALRMAKRCGARLRVVTIVSADVEHEAMVGQLLKQEVGAAHAHLEQVQEQANAAGVACETEVLHASIPDEAIVHAAEHARSDLVIMGRRGRRGLARLMLGDITARVIGRAPCNVLVVPRAAELHGQHFVVATDGSRFGDAAAVTAGRLARLCGTPVTVVSVTQPSHSEERRAEARQAVNRTVSFLKKEDVDVTGDVPHGRPDEMIVRAATQKQTDLIIMGSHGRTGLERVLLGSTTERVINQTETVVLVVKSA